MRNWKRLDLNKPPVEAGTVVLRGILKGNDLSHVDLCEMGRFKYGDDRLQWHSGGIMRDVAQLTVSHYLWWCPIPDFDGV